MAVPEQLLRILACPSCHQSLEEIDKGLRCLGCGLIYPVRDDIPIMLIEEATSWEQDGE